METGRGEEVIYGPASIRLLPPTKGWRVTKKTHASSTKALLSLKHQKIKEARERERE